MPLITHSSSSDSLTSWEYVTPFGSINVDFWQPRSMKNLSINMQNFNNPIVSDIKYFSKGEYPDLGSYKYYIFPPEFNFIELSITRIEFILTCFSPAVDNFYMGASARYVLESKCCNISNGLNKILGVLGG